MSKETQMTKTKGSAPERAARRTTFTPQVDIIEKPDSFVVLADLPGVTQDDLEVTLEKGVLTIQASAKAEEAEGLRADYAEYEVGDFYRSFALGRGLNAEGVEARLKDGVLRLVIPKSEEYKARRIEIAAD